MSYGVAEVWPILCKAVARFLTIPMENLEPIHSSGKQSMWWTSSWDILRSWTYQTTMNTIIPSNPLSELLFKVYCGAARVASC